MTGGSRLCLILRALVELALYDVSHAGLGFQRTMRLLAPPKVGASERADLEARICAAVQLATSLYFKRVRCLQRSFCTTRLLRAYGIPARLVIGYRPVPFFSHAWVEVGTRAVEDGASYRERLRILYTA